MTAAPGEVCGICAAPLRPAARYCGRCGAEHGRMVPRELGVGTVDEMGAARRSAPLSARGLVVAMVVYAALLVPVLYVIARPEALARDGTVTSIHVVTLLVGVAGLAALGRAGWGALSLRRWRLVDAAIAVVATAAVFVAARVLRRPEPWLFIEIDDLYVHPSWSLATALLHATLLQAMAEELAFRGAILTGLRGLLTDRSAIIAAALLSAIVHLSVPSMLHLTVFGIILGWTRVRTGSLWPCVALHAGYNAAAVLLAPS